MKRFIATMLSGVLLASSIPATAMANVYDIPENELVYEVPAEDIKPIIVKVPGSGEEPTAEKMEKALLAVKSKIKIPDEYSEFNYYFYDGNQYSDAYWRFVWNTADYNKTIMINCDKDHHITYYYKYNYSEKSTGIANYLKDELKSKAEEFIVSIAPELKNKFEFLSADYESIYSGNYVYRFQRKENNVAFPDNTIQVSVNSITGEVNSISINWLYGKSVPSATTKITKEEAAKLIKENMKMKLVYKSDYGIIFDKNGNPKTRAYLVYEPSQYYISVDAKTGKVYNESSEWIYNNLRMEEATKDELSMETATGAAPVTLTEKEIAKIRELNDLISMEEAIKAVTSNKSLYLDPNLKSTNASLSKIEQNGKTSYVWNIDMNDPRKIDYNDENEDYYRAYAHAAVDAKSGKIISFYASLKTFYDGNNKKWESVDIKYNMDQAREIFEGFLKSEISSKFKNSILANSLTDYVMYYTEKMEPVYGGYRFIYNRTNEGIEYQYNNIYGSVDGVTGKVYSFGYNWNENIEFEAPKGIISPEEAMDYYLSNEGFGLKYEINTINKMDESKDNFIGIYSVDYEIRLVYRPDVYPRYISPFTGEQLNHNGTVFKETQPYSYSDITDPKKYRNVLLLADMGIGFEGGKFQPEKAITVGEFNRILSDIGYGYYNKLNDASAEKTITREEAAAAFIYRLGLEQIAKLPGIYKTGYDDEASIKPEYIGAVALAKALGLMGADTFNYFNPKNEISRIDAVNLIINYINLQKTGIYY